MSDSEGSDSERKTRPSHVPLLTPRGGQAPPPTVSYHEEANPHGVIELTLNLPEGDPFTKTFSKGDTVFNIKKTVHDEKGLEWKGMVVEFEGNALLDPLSLNDFPALNDRTSATFNIKIQ